MTAALTPDQRTLTHTRRVLPAVNGQAACVGCWTGRGRRHAAEFSKPPTRYRLGRPSRTVTVSDPLPHNLLVNITQIVWFVGPFLFLFPLISLFFQQREGSRHAARRWHLQLSALHWPCQQHPCPTLCLTPPAFQLPLLLSHPPSLVSFPSPAPDSPSRVGPVRACQASAQPVWTPACRRTARRPGLRGDVTMGDVTTPPGVPPGPPTQEPSC